MGRKSREKRERRRAERIGSRDKLITKRLDLGVGLEIIQRGRFIELINSQTPEEFERHVNRLRTVAAEIPARLHEGVQRLRELISALPVSQTLAELAVARYTADPETFKEPDIPPYVVLEYLTWLLLTNDPAPEVDGPPVKPSDLGELFELLDEVIGEMPWKLSPEVVRDLITRLEGEGPEGFGEVVFALLEGASDTRDYVAASIEKQRERASEVGAAGFRIFIGDLALAFLSSSDPERMDIGAYTDTCFAQKEVAKAVGLLEPADGSRLRVAVRASAPTGAIRAASAEDITRKMRSRFAMPGDGPPNLKMSAMFSRRLTVPSRRRQRTVTGDRAMARFVQRMGPRASRCEATLRPAGRVGSLVVDQTRRDDSA